MNNSRSKYRQAREQYLYLLLPEWRQLGHGERIDFINKKAELLNIPRRTLRMLIADIEKNASRPRDLDDFQKGLLELGEKLLEERNSDTEREAETGPECTAQPSKKNGPWRQPGEKLFRERNSDTEQGADTGPESGIKKLEIINLGISTNKDGFLPIHTQIASMTVGEFEWRLIQCLSSGTIIFTNGSKHVDFSVYELMRIGALQFGIDLDNAKEHIHE